MGAQNDIRKLIERAIRDVKPSAAIYPKPTESLYKRTVIGPRNRALAGGLAAVGAGGFAYSLSKNRNRK